MLQDIIAKDRELIPYRKELNKLTGSVTATLFLTQVIYWWYKNGKKPFYKFRSGTDSKGNKIKHPDYKDGDSWCEELGFTEKELDYAMSLVCAKQNALRKDAKTSLKENLVKPYVICKIDMNRKTYYSLNIELLENDLNMLYSGRLGNIQKVDYVSTETEITKSTKGRLDIYTETTTETTNIEKNTQSKNFANSPSFDLLNDKQSFGKIKTNCIEEIKVEGSEIPLKVMYADNNSMQIQKETAAEKPNNNSMPKEKEVAAAADFETFCKAFPNRLGKSKAEEKFYKAVKKIGFEKLMLCVENYKQHVESERKNGFKTLQYMQVSRFVNKDYLDFLPTEKTSIEIIQDGTTYKGIALSSQVKFKVAGGMQENLDFGQFLKLCVKSPNNLHNYYYNGNQILPTEIENITQLLKGTKYEN